MKTKIKSGVNVSIKKDSVLIKISRNAKPKSCTVSTSPKKPSPPKWGQTQQQTQSKKPSPPKWSQPQQTQSKGWGQPVVMGNSNVPKFVPNLGLFKSNNNQQKSNFGGSRTSPKASGARSRSPIKNKKLWGVPIPFTQQIPVPTRQPTYKLNTKNKLFEKTPPKKEKTVWERGSDQFKFELV